MSTVKINQNWISHQNNVVNNYHNHIKLKPSMPLYKITWSTLMRLKENQNQLKHRMKWRGPE